MAYKCPFTNEECMEQDCNFYDRELKCILRSTLLKATYLANLLGRYIDADDSKDKKESADLLSKLGSLIKKAFKRGTGITLPNEADGGKISKAHRPMLWKEDE